MKYLIFVNVDFRVPPAQINFSTNLRVCIWKNQFKKINWHKSKNHIKKY